MSFRYRITLAIVAVETVVLSIVLWQSLSYMENKLEGQFEAASHALMEQLAGHAALEAIITEDFSPLQFQLEELQLNDSIEVAVLLSTDGRVLASSDVAFLGNQFNFRGDLPWTVIEVRGSSGSLASLAYQYNKNIAQQASIEAMQFGIALGVIGILITAIVSIIICWLLTARLENIAKLADSLRRGQFKDMQVDTSSDEIGRLSRFIHDMGERITTHVRDLVVAEERFRLAIKAAGAGAWKWDLRNNELYWSAGSYQALGYLPNRDTPTYELWRSAIHPDDLARVDTAVSTMLKESVGIDVEYRTLRPNGQVRWMHSVGSVHYNYQDEPDEIYGLQIDITRYKTLQNNLSNQKQLLQAVLDNSSDCVISIDTRMQILTANYAAAELFCCGVKALWRQSLTNFLNERDVRFIEDYIDGCLKREDDDFSRSTTYGTGKRTDGTEFKASISVRGLGNSNDSLRFVVTMANLTQDRRRHNEPGSQVTA